MLTYEKWNDTMKLTSNIQKYFTKMIFKSKYGRGILENEIKMNKKDSLDSLL